jgi:(2Fe-2S) ferredoxin
MSNDAKPVMAPYARHVLICIGKLCDPGGKASALYESLPGLLGDLAAYRNPLRVKRGVCPCLGVCSAGPIVVVYPEGVWYANVNTDTLQRIVEEHLRHGCIVEDAVFHQLGTHKPDSRLALDECKHDLTKATYDHK